MKNPNGWILPEGFPDFPKDWVAEWETVRSSEGRLQLFISHLHKKEWTSPKAVFVIPGMGEHSGRYAHFAHYLQDTVQAVFSMDTRGHGRSEGLRGHVDRFDLFAEDAAIAIRHVENLLVKRFGRAEIHLVGHSMGGLIALRTVLTDMHVPIKTLTLSAPLLGIRVPLGVAKKTAAQILSRVWSNFQMDSEVPVELLSHDSGVAAAYLADRLNHKKGTPRLYTEMLKAIEDTLSRTRGIEMPLLMILPGQDQVVDSPSSRRFFDSLEHSNKTLKEYADFYHESFNELGKEKAFSDLKSFIQSNTL